MDMGRYLIGDTWRWRDIWRNLLTNLTEFDARDRFVIIAYRMDFS